MLNNFFYRKPRYIFGNILQFAYLCTPFLRRIGMQRSWQRTRLGGARSPVRVWSSRQTLIGDKHFMVVYLLFLCNIATLRNHPINIGGILITTSQRRLCLCLLLCRTRISRRTRIFESCGLFSLRFLLEGLINIRLIRVITFRWSVGLRQISCSFKPQSRVF